MISKLKLAIIVSMVSVTSSLALGPHELLILANGSEPDSVEVARKYALLRQVPECNVLVLKGLPPFKQGQKPEILPEDFTRLIWAPALREASERGISNQILAWAYSSHFPIRILSQPPISIQGLTFVRNQMPLAADIAKGSYESPLFAGPDGPQKNSYGPQSFDTYRDFLRDEMPLPSMMLGYIGERGNTKAEVLACMQRGVVADATHPPGGIYFVISDDVRSKCRQWQFGKAALGLRQDGIEATVGKSFPAGKENVIGVMMGLADVEPERVGSFAPGAMAEHLTSAAAIFSSPNQTKLSRWIAAGATASAGAVWEPMSYWQKFPNARFFNHYSTGATMIESFYLSIRCPLQLLLVGEPLSAPWAESATLSINNLGVAELIEKPRVIEVNVKAQPGVVFRRFVYLIDGVVRGEGPSFTLDPAGLMPGEHILRVVAHKTGFMRSQIFEEKQFVVRHSGK
jgi:uncharacterized protein (TIGR03790 family)